MMKINFSTKYVKPVAIMTGKWFAKKITLRSNPIGI